MDRKSKYLLFALPSFILIFTVMLFPVGYAIIYSFTDFRLGKSAKFIGLENYISIFQDSEFLSALGFTLILTLVAVLSQFVIGMILALLLDNIHHFKKPISIMIYIPYFITAAAMGVIFRWMFMSNWDMPHDRNKYTRMAGFTVLVTCGDYFGRGISEYAVFSNYFICRTSVNAVGSD